MLRTFNKAVHLEHRVCKAGCGTYRPDGADLSCPRCGGESTKQVPAGEVKLHESAMPWPSEAGDGGTGLP